MAVNKLQKAARRKKAFKAVQAEQQWKLFANLDTQDEAEMLNLAVFMQTLVNSVTNADDSVKNSVKNGFFGNDEFDGFSSIEIDVSNIEDINTTIHPNQEYCITGSVVDASIAIEIIDWYRKGGKLSRKAIVKILKRIYRILLVKPNTNHITIQEGTKLTVVGDLHGQLSDLLHILDHAGLPGPQHKYIFNGDFVDRGTESVEVIVIIFSLLVAYGPDTVYLNRGNHEDIAVCRVYGFEAEVHEKYDHLLFEMFTEVFNYLALFTVINNSIFVVHGGLFHSPLVTLSDLEEINRSDYNLKPAIPYPTNIIGLTLVDTRKEYLKQLQRDSLWSDPCEENGTSINPRGAGVFFGPDIASAFMRLNNLHMVIRSHECAYTGFDLPYSSIVEKMQHHYNPPNPPTPRHHHHSHQHKHSHHHYHNPQPPIHTSVQDQSNIPLLCTLFSASNYSGGDNQGAYMCFHLNPESTISQGCQAVGQETNLFYSVHHFKTSDPEPGVVGMKNNLSLRELIFKKKKMLLSNFQLVDSSNNGVVTRNEWAEVMQKITTIQIRWLMIIASLVPLEALTPSTVDYNRFLDSFHLNLSGETPHEKMSIIDDLYSQRRKLESVFYFFDTNGDGIISQKEFREGCRILNENLHPDVQLVDIDHTLKLMDFDGSGTIDINEFFETFRILDAKDGKLDGVLSIANRSIRAVKQ